MVKKIMLIMSKEDVANSTFVLIYSLTRFVFDDSFKDRCSENFVIFLDKYSTQSLLLKKLQHVESQFF